LKNAIPVDVDNSTPDGLAGTGMLTSPVQMTNFAFGIPATARATIRLSQRGACGYLLGGAFLVYEVVEAVSVASDQLFGHAGDQSQPLAAVSMFVVLTLIGLVPAVIYFRHFRERPEWAHEDWRYA
jgi:hypothetical protein